MKPLTGSSQNRPAVPSALGARRRHQFARLKASFRSHRHLAHDLVEMPSCSPIPDCDRIGLASKLAMLCTAFPPAASDVHSQAILNVLLHTCLKLTGATRAAVVAIQGTEQCVAAVVMAGVGSPSPKIVDSTPQQIALPQSVIHHVLNTGAELVLENASSVAPFKDDHYITIHRTRRIICLPLIRHEKIVGSLYIECQLSTSDRVPEEIAVLRFFARLLAVLLESYRLIEEVDQQRKSLRRAQVDLEHASRVMTLSVLQSSLAHELSQPLAALTANAAAAIRWLDHDPPNLHETRESLGSIVSQGIRAAAIIDGMRDLLRKTTPSAPARLQMNDLVGETLTLVRGKSSEEQIAITTDLSPDLPPVSGNKVQLLQVILNLALNALDALKGITERPRILHICSRNFGKKGVIVSVQDSGAGLTQQANERMFEPFFTTKDNGLGMGLIICNSIIKAHGGHLWCSSGNPTGTVFNFSIPSLPVG